MKKSLLMKTMLLLFALVTGSTCAWAVEQVYKTLTFCNAGTTVNKVGSYESNWTETVGTAPNTFSWTITNFNNNNWQWTDGTPSLYVIKCGRKKGKSANTPSVATIVTDAAIDEAITKVNVTLTAINATDYNSIKLYMASNADFDADLVTVNVSPIPTAAGTMTITIPEANRTANRYYKLAFDTKGSGSSNGHTGIKKVEYYYDYVSAATLDHITLGGTYQTEFEQGSDFNHDGLTVTAHYSDASTLDVTSSATFTGYNMNTLGKQTVTVSYEENSVTKTATYDITVVPVPTSVVTLDFTSNEWGISASPNKTVDATVFTRNGYSITLEGSVGNGYYFDTNNLLLGKTGATLTLPAFGFNVSKIKVYGTSGASASVKFNVFVGDEAVSTEVTNSTDDHEFAIEAGKQAVGTIYTIKVTNSNNMRISKIEVYGNGCEAGVVTDAGWATYVTTCDMEFAEGDAFVVSAANATTATLAGVTKIRANQPVLLKGEGAKTAKVLDEAPAAVSNELAISIGGSIDGFVLAKPAGKSAGFYKWNGGSLTSGKVYLPAPTAARDYLEFSFDGETTGLNELTNTNRTNNTNVYDLQGRKVANPTKGLYIVNGRKVIIK